MKTRLQLIDGFIAGTLTKEEIAQAETNPNVVKAIEYQNKLSMKKEKSDKRKSSKKKEQ